MRRARPRRTDRDFNQLLAAADRLRQREAALRADLLRAAEENALLRRMLALIEKLAYMENRR